MRKHQPIEPFVLLDEPVVSIVPHKIVIVGARTYGWVHQNVWRFGDHRGQPREPHALVANFWIDEKQKLGLCSEAYTVHPPRVDARPGYYEMVAR